MEKMLKYIRIIWCDAAGIRRCRVVISDTDDIRLIQERYINGVGITRAIMSVPSWGDVVVEGIGENAGSAVGETRLCLFNDSFYFPPWSKHEIYALGTFLNPDRTSWSCCPRSVLKHVTTIAEMNGLTFQIGFETEFVLFSNVSNIPIDDTVYCHTYGYDKTFPYLAEVTESLQAMGILVEQLHPESGPGQFEIVTKHSDPCSAADQLIITKETISSIANKYNMRASYAPKYQENAAGNGQHCHISIWKEGKNLFENCRVPLNLFCPTEASECTSDTTWVDPCVNSFLAGLLNRLDVLSLFTAGSPNSKRRLRSHCWAGVYKCWGVNNKEAPLRLPTVWTDFPLTNVEYKLFDSTANPHIGLAVVLAAGLQGIALGETLPSPCTRDPDSLSVTQRSELGIRLIDSRSFTQRVSDFLKSQTVSSAEDKVINTSDISDAEHVPLAVSSDEALIKSARVEAVEEIAKALGGLVSEDVLATVLAVKDSEFAFFGDMSLDDEMQVLRFRY